MPKASLKSWSLNEMEDQYIGKAGTADREHYNVKIKNVKRQWLPNHQPPGKEPRALHTTAPSHNETGLFRYEVSIVT